MTTEASKSGKFKDTMRLEYEMSGRGSGQVCKQF